MDLIQLMAMHEHGELSPSVFYRRRTLLEITELAGKSKLHTPQSRWRLKKFREALEAEDNNDEIEANGQTICEIVMSALDAYGQR